MIETQDAGGAAATMTEAQAIRRVPEAPRSIAKGSSLADLLGADAVACLAHNLGCAYPRLERAAFQADSLPGLESLGIMQRGQHLARVMRAHLPPRYEDAVDVLLRSLTPPNDATHDLGLAVLFCQPHVSFVEAFGLGAAGNGGSDPFEASMQAQRELTRRFSAEFFRDTRRGLRYGRPCGRLVGWSRQHLDSC